MIATIYPGRLSGAVRAPASKSAAHRLLKATGLKTLKELGLKREELLAVVPDEVVMQIEMEIKAFGGVAPPPLPVTKELVAEIINRAYDEN